MPDHIMWLTNHLLLLETTDLGKGFIGFDNISLGIRT